MASPVREGEVLEGKYRIERVLGEGGMGVVVSAYHLLLHERVAIKFLLPHLANQPDTIDRFLREARAAVRIKNEHIARVIDIGQFDTGTPYIVMEYLEGSDLAAHLRGHSTLTIEDAVDYVVQASEAIADAHAHGIVHRDLKPSNLMLVLRPNGQPCIKVLDFGISKIAPQEGAPSMTQTGASFGSPLYMSPEQMKSTRDVDERTDIWSLGTILYELLAGRVPFEAETQAALGAKIATDEPISIWDHRPDVPPGLEAIIARCLKKRREERFGSVAELLQALSPFAPSRSRSSIERASPVVGGGGTEKAGSSTIALPGSHRATVDVGRPPVGVWARTTTGMSRKTKTAAIAGALVVAAAGVSALVAVRRASPLAPAAEPSDSRIEVVASATSVGFDRAELPPVTAAPPPASVQVSPEPPGASASASLLEVSPRAAPRNATGPRSTLPRTGRDAGQRGAASATVRSKSGYDEM